jgi:hypothetical protein
MRGRKPSRHTLIKRAILSYGTNQIHEACEIIGRSTGWMSFTNELKSDSFDDSKELLTVLMSEFGEDIEE